MTPEERAALHAEQDAKRKAAEAAFWRSRREEYAQAEALKPPTNIHARHRRMAMLRLWGTCEPCFLSKLRWMLRQPRGSHERRHGERIQGILRGNAVQPDRERRYVYHVASRSRDGIVYTVQVAGARAACNCPGDYFPEAQCHHAKEVLEVTQEMIPFESTEAALAPVDVRSVTRQMPDREEFTMMAELSRAAPYAAGLAFPREINTPGAALIVMMHGYSMGLAPIDALQHIYPINGRLMPSAQVQMGMVKANVPGSNYRFEFRSEGRVLDGDTESLSAADHVVAILTIDGKEVGRASYSTEDALRAGQLQWKRRANEDGEITGEPVLAPGEKRSTAWVTHRHLMLAYNAVRLLNKLRVPEVIHRISPRMRSLMEGVAGSDAIDVGSVDLSANPELDAIPFGDDFRAAVAEELKRANATPRQLRTLIGEGVTVEKYLREHPTSSLRKMAQDAAKLPVEASEAPEAKDVTPEPASAATGAHEASGGR